MEKYINRHDELEVTAETRAALRELAGRLGEEQKTILTCVTRVSNQVRSNAFETFYTVTDPATREVVMQIATKNISSETFRDWLLLQVGNTCASCLGFLLEGEDGLCVTCESREIMDLLRLRNRLA